MPREIAFFDTYMPSLILICLGGAGLTWLLDRVLAYVSLYKVVWHPALFRASLLVIVCGGLSLFVYR
ncbi:DUF1656 domain-containing protein [Burkholderia sp. Ac-20365]|jgi:hypothetical protein|uniref:DUF1656 domain-containing protein n=1 Tax=Burkholderia sp. Ac-20365 TaxID=2703897 RepID=UPI00197C64AE|nr:DUF1656 domain-containing protein [Burkholderia sp. Ac-20365]MBN3759349.1 DUF1656 domain-containing protein [Burkholderia sp. Ac-20365]